MNRTVMPRPSPISCRNSDGRWYQLLNVETMGMITAFERNDRGLTAPAEILPTLRA